MRPSTVLTAKLTTGSNRMLMPNPSPDFRITWPNASLTKQLEICMFVCSQSARDPKTRIANTLDG